MESGAEVPCSIIDEATSPSGSHQHSGFVLSSCEIILHLHSKICTTRKKRKRIQPRHYPTVHSTVQKENVLCTSRKRRKTLVLFSKADSGHMHRCDSTREKKTIFCPWLRSHWPPLARNIMTHWWGWGRIPCRPNSISCSLA